MMGTTQDWSQFSMWSLFCMEAETQIDILNHNLLELENNSHLEYSTRNELLETLMRATHSLKGAARIVQIEVVVQIAHLMEDYFVAVQQNHLQLQPEHIDILLQGVDLLGQIGQVEESDWETWLPDHEEIIAEQLAGLATILEPKAQIENQVFATNENEQPWSHFANPTLLEEDEENPVSLEPTFPEIETTPKTAVTPQSERVVRISSDNLNQLMALAGESLVEVNWLGPFAKSLLQIKRQQQQLSSNLEKIRELVPHAVSSQTLNHYLGETYQKSRDCHELLSNCLNDLELFSRRFTHLSDNLYREVIASHMRPFLDGVQGFPRMVRDLAKQLGKQVKLEISGQSTQVDRDILNRLESPLTHMLRNAITHGIESPQERLMAGKPEMGTIELIATHRAGMLSITVKDDGRGIDLDFLRDKIVAGQLTTPPMAAQLTETELMEFLFLPGFSTTQEVTEIAGRGFGLDIAKSMVQEVGGILRASNQPGQGMTFHFQLPLTLSVMRALLVEIAGEPYGFGLTRIEQVLAVEPDKISIAENCPYIVVDDRNISLVWAYQVLQLSEIKQSNQVHLSVIIISDQSHTYGLVVDKFLGERDLVIRSLDPRLGKVPNISAAALMEDGSPMLIVDVADLVRSINNSIAGGSLQQMGQDFRQGTQQDGKTVLVVDDSITVREMERKLLQNYGYQVDVAVNGMEGWNAVRMKHYDLVISDIDMPRMNGIELVEQIKSHPKLKFIPVIIVSYKDREDDKMAGLQAGADYYLTKSSFHDDSLVGAVVDLIG